MSERISSSSRSRTIKLFCPSLSKIVPWVILEEEEEEKLDLGSIARTFGLEPSTLKLNRHFISRGIDLISSSVTWKSLLSFFASRGLSTGTNDSDALIVDGKLLKSGTKRTHISPVVENGDQQSTTDYNDLAIHRKPQVEGVNLLKKRKMNESKPGMVCPLDAQNGDPQTNYYHDLAINRRPLLEDVHLLKKRKLIQSTSGLLSHSNAEKGDHRTIQYKDLALNRRPLVEDVNLLKKRKITTSNSGAIQLSNGGTDGDEDIKHDVPGVKRKSWLGDVNPLKKMKMYITNLASDTLVV